MTFRFLLDTNVVSEPLKPVPNEKVLRRLAEHEGEIVTSAVTWHELLFGVRRLPRGRRRRALEDYVAQVVAALPVLAYDDEAAEWHAVERARLERRGRTPSFADAQVAAIAAVNDLGIVTRNVKHFADFRDVHVVDWSR